jgi:hypothetical protein
MDVNSLIFSLFGIFIGSGFFIGGFHILKQKRLIENLPTSKIRSIAMGLVEIYGVVVPKNLLKTPFTKKDAVYYKYKVEEYRSQGRNSKWVTVDRGETRSHFYLKDKTGSVLIDPTGAQIDIPYDYSFKSSSKKQPPEVIRFLNTRKKRWFGNPRRYTEYFIAPNDKLYILGTAGDNPFVKEATARHSMHDIMIQNGRPIYYISDKHEQHVLTSLKWRSFGSIFGGGVLLIGSVGYLLFSLGLF